jgi:predicted nucleic acid-binding Zn ribbon protein
MRNANEKPLRKAIEEFLAQYHLNEKIDKAKIMASWEKVVGNAVAAHTRRLYFRGNKLYVKVEPSALKNELIFSRTRIIRELNAAAGSPIVEELVIT